MCIFTNKTLIQPFDKTSQIFGAFLTDAPHPSPHFYGTGECFLWRAQILPSIPELSSLPPPPSADTTHLTGRMTTIALTPQHSSASLRTLGSLGTDGETARTNGTSNGHTTGTHTPERIRFKAFPYTGENDFCIFTQQEYLSVGGGDGHYGLWLDNGLENGHSSRCETFGNEPLSDEGTKFGVIGVELWVMGV